jgi:hypothetical protein
VASRRRDRQLKSVGKTEVFVVAASDRGGEVAVAIDQSRQKRLPPTVDDLGVGIGLHDLFGRTNRGNGVAADRECDIDERRTIGAPGNNGCMSKDNRPTRVI